MKKKRIVAGSSTQTDIRVRGDPEPDRHLFNFLVDTSTQLDDLRTYISDRGVTMRSLNCVSNVSAQFKSYKLTVPVSQYKQLFNGDLWPEGVRVRPYYPKSANSDRDNTGSEG